MVMKNKNVESRPLIMLVKKRPFLYDPKHTDYTNRELKAEAWNEITQALIGDASWNAMSDSERETSKYDVKLRWKSLKDAYIRSLRTKGRSAAFYRPYVYGQHMEFIKKIYYGTRNRNEDEEEEEAEGEDSDNQYQEGEVYSFLQVGVDQEESSTSFQEVEDSLKSSRTEQEPVEEQEEDVQSRRKRKSLKTEESSRQEGTSGVEFGANSGPSFIDEDKFFLLSLVPQLKEMSPVEKLDFKINVMQLLKTNVVNRNKHSKS